MRLAYFSPLGPQRSGISDYSEELLPHLAAGAEITLFVDGFQPSNRELGSRFEVCDYAKQPSVLSDLKNFDAVLYHMGNDHRYHAGILDAMLHRSGIVVFHDFALQDFYLGLARDRGDMSTYLNEVAACHGEDVRREAEEALAEGAQPPALARPTDFPLNYRVARAAEGIIAHSEWSRQRFARIAPSVPVAHIQMPVKPPSHRLRRHRAWTVMNPLQRKIKVASFGLITPGKGTEQILRALAELRDEYDFHYTLVGEENPYFDARALISGYGMSDRTTITGHISLAEFEGHIAETDIAINLRERTVGETSASLCRIMAAGVPAVVSDVGWFSELPDGCVVKIDPDEDMADRLKAHLSQLLGSARRRRRIGASARRHVLAKHGIEQSAAHYLSFIREVIARSKDPQRMHPTHNSIARSPDVQATHVAARANADDQATIHDAIYRNGTSRRMRIAYFSPLSPQPSGVSDYSEELLPHLAAHADVDLFVDGFRCNNPKITTYFRFFDYRRDSSALDRLNDYDAIVYHLGNDHRYHAGIYDAMCRHPGLVVFHDFALQDFFLALARNAGDMSLYLNEVAACHGERERATAEKFLELGGKPPQFAEPLVFPLNCRLARAAEGIIVHSEWSRQRFEEVAPSVPVVRINHHVTSRAAAQPIAVEAPEAGKRVMIASFGMITPDKGIGRALSALAALRNECDFHYTLVGAPGHFPEVHELIQRYGLEDRVTITGYVPLTTFERHIAETDIAINLRERPVGATSGSLCRVMAAGVAAIVSNVGPFAELPGDAVIKIEHDSYADALLVAYLRRLITDSDLRRRIGANARRLMLAEHSIEESAARYAAFIREVIARRPRKQFLKSVADEISALGIRAKDDAFLRGVASEIAVLAPVVAMATGNSALEAYRNSAAAKAIIKRNGNAPSLPSASSQDRMTKLEGIDYKRAARDYPRRLDDERRHYLLTKPFYNLANKPLKHLGDGMDAETFRHFCDFANMAVALALPAGSRILDVGCGSGWLSEYFARLGYIMKGIDISADLVEMARERTARVPYDVDHQTALRCSFAVHDIESAPLPEKFDAVICYDSLHHFEDEGAVMQHMAAMLQVGGLLFVLEGQRPPVNSPTEAELVEVMHEFGTLESPFAYQYLRQLLDEHGFAVIGDYASVNGLFERETIKDDLLPLHNVPLNYHYLACKKVASGAPASTVPDSRRPGLLRARIALTPGGVDRLAPGQALGIELEIENTGDTLWLAGRETRTGVVMPGVRISDDAGQLVSEFHGEPPLPRAVAPGETIRLRIEHAAPERSGTYTLKFDLVDQQVCWFEDVGSEPLTVAFEVRE